MNWNFELIYKTKDDYEKDLNFIKEKTQEMASFQGKLNDYETLKKFLALNEEMEIKLSKALS